MACSIFSGTTIQPTARRSRWRRWKYALSRRSELPIPTRRWARPEMNGDNQPANEASQQASTRSGGSKSDPPLGKVIRAALRRIGLVRDGEPSVRDTLDELIEEAGNENEAPLGEDERMLLANILSIRDLSVDDVMVPRADIVAVDSEATLAEVIDVMTSSGHSRLPVYRETLDDAIGMVHTQDVLDRRGGNSRFKLSKLLRRVLFVAPSMRVLQLLLEMRA